MLELIIATGDELYRVWQKEEKPTNGEEQWRAARLDSGRGVRCLAADPARTEVLYAGSRGEGVWKSSDGGRSWAHLEFPESDVFSLAVSPADGAVYAGTEPSKLFVSRDEGRSWRELTALQEIPSRPEWSFPPRPSTSHVRAIAPNSHDASLLLVGIELGGVMRSEDGGESWSDHPEGAQKDVHSLIWHPTAPGRAYEAGGAGAAWSRDGGLSWQPADEGRDRHYTWGLAADPDDPDCWFISANPSARLAHRSGQENAEAYVYRWQGQRWQPLGGGLPQPLGSFPYVLMFHSGRLLAGLGDGRIYCSKDQGDSWSQLSIHGEVPSSILAITPLE